MAPRLVWRPGEPFDGHPTFEGHLRGVARYQRDCAATLVAWVHLDEFPPKKWVGTFHNCGRICNDILAADTPHEVQALMSSTVQKELLAEATYRLGGPDHRRLCLYPLADRELDYAYLEAQITARLGQDFARRMAADPMEALYGIPKKP